MKKILNLVLISTILLTTLSCSKSITPNQAANGRAKCGKNLK